MFSKLNSTKTSRVAKKSYFIQSYIKLGLVAFLSTAFAVACGNKNDGNGAVAGVAILSVANGGAGTGFGGVTSLTVSVGDSSGLPAQTYVLNVGVGAINGDLRQIGQNVYELQATCANANCSDVAFMIVARRGFANTGGTFNNYFNGANPLAGDGVNYPATASTNYVLTTQPMGSVEFLYRATGGTTGITWVLTKTLVDNTGQISVLNQAQILALEQP